MNIRYSVFYYAALLLLTLPLDWTLGFLCAAIFHELCHILAVVLLNGKIHHIDIHISGCVMETSPFVERKQILSILAGPLGSIFLVFLYCKVPKIAVCGLFHGLYNLIPVLPLDGGRILQLILYRISPGRADNVMDLIAIASCLVFDILAIVLYAGFENCKLPLVIALVWNIKILPRKIPCKPAKIGVQ